MENKYLFLEAVGIDKGLENYIHGGGGALHTTSHELLFSMGDGICALLLASLAGLQCV